MADWVGVGFFVFLIVAAFVGLRRLANPRALTSEEFERSVSEARGGIAAVGSALQDFVDPAQARAKIVVTQMREGRFLKKRREGKANDSDER